jgi:hypothetical protein
MRRLSLKKRWPAYSWLFFVAFTADRASIALTPMHAGQVRA